MSSPSDPPPSSQGPAQRPDTETPERTRRDMETTVFHVPRPRFAASVAPMWQIRVEVVGGPMDGLRKRADGDALEIGRGADNDLCLPLDPGVSARHARIVREDRTFWLEDLESRNGTYLGEERLLRRVPIGPGATFAVNRTQIQFMPR